MRAANEIGVCRTKGKGGGFRRRLRANRTTFAWVWGFSSIALCGPIVMAGPELILVMVAAALGVASMMSISLNATIEVDAENRLVIRYLVYSFHDRLDNIQIDETPKFNFRHDDCLGVKKLYRGTRLPCFNVGWFVLRNGAVAFVCVTRKRKAQALKTRDGCYILVDPRIARRIQAAARRFPPVRRGPPDRVHRESVVPFNRSLLSKRR